MSQGGRPFSGVTPGLNVISEMVSDDTITSTILPQSKRFKPSNPQKRKLEWFFYYISEKEKNKIDEASVKQMMGDRQYKLKKEVVKILIDETSEEKLTHSLTLLIAVYCIADIGEDWVMLTSSENPSYDLIATQIDTILIPIALVANLFHPVYWGQRLANDQTRMREIMKFLIDELDKEGMNDFLKYNNSREIFDSRKLREYTDGQIFWQAVAPIHPT